MTPAVKPAKGQRVHFFRSDTEWWLTCVRCAYVYPRYPWPLTDTVEWVRSINDHACNTALGENE
jgi:hypothetical protein